MMQNLNRKKCQVESFQSILHIYLKHGAPELNSIKLRRVAVPTYKTVSIDFPIGKKTKATIYADLECSRHIRWHRRGSLRRQSNGGGCPPRGRGTATEYTRKYSIMESGNNAQTFKHDLRIDFL